MKEGGKFIVLYGPNNIGKTSQVSLLVEALTALGLDAKALKYPVYELEPTGRLLNSVLREGNKQSLNAEQIQELFARNRRDYEPELTKELAKGTWVVSEDYTGTGFAWGLTFGVSFEKLVEFNKGLRREDLAICLIGDRFTTGIERVHLHERSEKWELNRAIHIELAEYFNWEVINANQSIEEVKRDIWEVVRRRLIT